MIETQRLLLRRWRETDRAPFAAMGKDPQVMRFFPSLLGRAESDRMIDERLEPHFDRHGFGLWAVERREDGAFLGFTGLAVVDHPCPIENEVEIGWRLARHVWGQGYATEAAQAALARGFGPLGLSRVVAMAVAANTPSLAVMERLGMRRRPELDFEHSRVPLGSPVRPHIVYAIEAAEAARAAPAK